MQFVLLENISELEYAMKESLRALKTNIQFCGDDIQTILVTSTIPNEGKSTVTIDLARSLTESGKRVLLVDTDMRKSVLIGRLRAKNAAGGEIYGLSHFLSGRESWTRYCILQISRGCLSSLREPSVPNPTKF